jgi:hypothetical protein
MQKVTREQAEIEVQSWLAKKKIFEETKEKQKSHIEVIVEAMMNGVLVLNPETFEFIHTLLFPIGEKEDVTTLTYKARLNDKDKAPYLKGVKSDDFEESYNAHLAALTKSARGIIALLDSTDKRIASAIGVFFT